jgi:D-alanine-D-alanine ligase
MRIGIFFGGQSREREISYLGGRTAYENLDRTLFEPVPIFVDSFGNFVWIEPDFLYKSGIRDFYPPFVPKPYTKFEVYAESFDWEMSVTNYLGKIGYEMSLHHLKTEIDFAFIALHGQPGEDGSLQGLFEWTNLPYSSCGILSSAIGIDKIIQTKLMNIVTKKPKKYTTISWKDWQASNKKTCFEHIVSKVGFPFVAKAPHQGSSIGVAIVKEANDLQSFVKAVNRCFFVQELRAAEWQAMTNTEKEKFLQDLTDLDKGIAFPLIVENETILHPQSLWKVLDRHFDIENSQESPKESLVLYAVNAEDEVLFEEFIVGQEFSCGVLQDENGKAVALPPTEIISAETFDFDSKYKVGGSRKKIPIDTSNENIAQIQQDVCTVFEELGFNVCARIDGFLTSNNEVLLHDPNTVPGMSPASLIFKQTAEIGLNISQTLTYLIRTSLTERAKVAKNTMTYRKLAAELDKKIEAEKERRKQLPKLAIVFGTDAALAAAKKLYTKLYAEGNYAVVPVLKTAQKWYALPVNLMTKDSVAEIEANLLVAKHPAIAKTIENASNITKKYAGDFPQKAWEVTENEFDVVEFA